MILPRATSLARNALLSLPLTLPAARTAAHSPGLGAAAATRRGDGFGPVLAAAAMHGGGFAALAVASAGILVLGIATRIFDGDTGKMLGLVSTSKRSDLALDPTAKFLYVSESLWTRIIRGTRQDLVAVYDPVTLDLVAEIPMPGRLLLGTHPAAPMAAIALLLVFAAAMVINIRRGRHRIDCGCGHPALRQTLGWSLVVRNLLFALALVLRVGGGAALDLADASVGTLARLAAFLLFQMFRALGALPTQRSGAKGWTQA